MTGELLFFVFISSVCLFFFSTATSLPSFSTQFWRAGVSRSGTRLVGFPPRRTGESCVSASSVTRLGSRTRFSNKNNLEPGQILGKIQLDSVKPSTTKSNRQRTTSIAPGNQVQLAVHFGFRFLLIGDWFPRFHRMADLIASSAKKWTLPSRQSSDFPRCIIQRHFYRVLPFTGNVCRRFIEFHRSLVARLFSLRLGPVQDSSHRFYSVLFVWVSQISFRGGITGFHYLPLGFIEFYLVFHIFSSFTVVLLLAEPNFVSKCFHRPVMSQGTNSLQSLPSLTEFRTGFSFFFRTWNMAGSKSWNAPCRKCFPLRQGFAFMLNYSIETRTKRKYKFEVWKRNRNARPPLPAECESGMTRDKLFKKRKEKNNCRLISGRRWNASNSSPKQRPKKKYKSFGSVFFFAVIY